MSKRYFDQGENRVNYGEMLLPEIGYDIVFAVGLTYSLDLEALLGVPVSLGLLDEIDESYVHNPYLLLEAIRKSSDKIAVFCNAGSMAMPQNIQSVFALLENSVFEVKLQNRQNFHPKLWFVKYSNGIDEYMKLIVLSRNLTFDRSFDYAVSMNGKITRKKNIKNQPLADMLNYVADFSYGAKKRGVLRLAEEIMQVSEFEISDEFEECEFIPLGIGSKLAEDTMIGDRYSDIFVVSPFLSDGIINDLVKKAKNKTLVTRKSSLTQNIMDCFDEVYITKDYVLQGDEIQEEQENGHDNLQKNIEKTLTQDIHAKIYFTRGENGNYLYVGSANASQNAFYKNVEFLLKLKFKTHQTSYDKIKSDFLPNDGFFEKLPELGELETKDSLESNIDDAFKDIIFAIKKAQVTATGASYQITVTTNGNRTCKKAFIAPIFKIDEWKVFDRQIEFDNIALNELSEFFTIKIDNEQTLCKIKTDGIPAERDKAIFKTIIGSKAGFLSYVSLILSDNLPEALLEQGEILKDMVSDGSTPANIVPTSLYENMLQTAVKNPYKLLDIENLLQYVDSDIVGDEFVETYKEFQSVAKGLVRRR